MKHLSVIVIAFVLFLPTSAVQADTPTPTPEPMYSRTDLLAKIAPKPFNITPAFQDIEIMDKFTDVTADGASWGLTLFAILEASGVPAHIAGIFLLMIIMFWLRKVLVEKMEKRELTPAEQWLKTSDTRKKYDRFRQDAKEFRQYRRRSRRG